VRIRDAKFSDLEQLLPLAHEAHENSIYGHIEMNEAIIQRHFVLAMQFDDGYAKVVEHDGQVVGGLIGLVGDNNYGIRHAHDMFLYSRRGTDLLIKDFVRWASVRGARFVRITDQSGNERYHELCRKLGMQQAGANFSMVM
jgi:hypothetical protein